MRFFPILFLCWSFAPAPPPNPTFSAEDFKHLSFLEGRWESEDRNNSKLYRQYTFTSTTEMTGIRFLDASFTEAREGISVTFENGAVTATWKSFTWRASNLKPNHACFQAINAPNSFCWSQLSESVVQFIRHWPDAQGNITDEIISLRKLPSEVPR